MELPQDLRPAHSVRHAGPTTPSTWVSMAVFLGAPHARNRATALLSEYRLTELYDEPEQETMPATTRRSPTLDAPEAGACSK